MEPFALFNLLQSLFNQKPTDAPPSESAETPVAPSEKTEEREEKPTETPSASQEAVLSFLSAHEARAKRTRKP